MLGAIDGICDSETDGFFEGPALRAKDGIELGGCDGAELGSNSSTTVFKKDTKS